MLEFLSVLFCLWLAARLRRRREEVGGESQAWVLARRSLRWGMLLATLPLLAYFGLAKMAHGDGLPSPYALVLTSCLCALVLMGARIEISRNVLVDSLLCAAGLVVACFVLLNGLPSAFAWLSGGNLGLWLLGCAAAAIAVRAALWLKEER